MLKEYLTMELERSQSRKAGYLQECRKLEAALKEADMLPMAQEQKLELVQSLNGILVGKQGAARIANDRITQLTGFLNVVKRAQTEEKSRQIRDLEVSNEKITLD